MIRLFCFLWLPLTALGVSAQSSRSIAVEQPRPNFVFLLAEDVSKHHFNLFDENGTETPSVRALAEQGLIYKHAFSNSPVCSVARTTLITGCYAPMIGAHHHRTEPKVVLPESIKFIPTYLRESGYYTTNKQKTDYNTTGGDAAWDESSKMASWRNRKDEQPFFHMQTFTATHEGRLHFPASDVDDKPITGLDKVFVNPRHPDSKLFRYTRARLHQNIRRMDQQLGKVVDQLREDGLLENTYIFFFGDHGGVMPGSKGYLYETGLHVPLVVRVPEKFRESNPEIGKTIEQFVSFVDFGPTLLNLASVVIPDHVSGRPFLGSDVDHDEVRNTTFGYADRFDERIGMVRSVRVGKYKYIRNFQPWYFDGLQNNYRYKMAAYQQWREMFKAGELNDLQASFFKTSPIEQLYDLESDPYETVNLAGDLGLKSNLLAARGMLSDHAHEMGTGKIQLGWFHDSKRRNRLITVLENGEREEFTAMLEHFSAMQSLIRNDFIEPVQKMVKEIDDPITSLRYIEWKAMAGSHSDPGKEILELLVESKDPNEANQILNAIVALRDGEKAYDIPITVESVHPKVREDKNVQRRLQYLMK